MDSRILVLVVGLIFVTVVECSKQFELLGLVRSRINSYQDLWVYFCNYCYFSD